MYRVSLRLSNVKLAIRDRNIHSNRGIWPNGTKNDIRKNNNASAGIT
jgi:hypothetical protein